MDSRGYRIKDSGNGPANHLHKLCHHIIKKDIVATDPQLNEKIENTIEASLKHSISYLNNAQPAQDDNTINEFSVAEKIKKYLVS